MKKILIWCVALFLVGVVLRFGLAAILGGEEGRSADTAASKPLEQAPPSQEAKILARAAEDVVLGEGADEGQAIVESSDAAHKSYDEFDNTAGKRVESFDIGRHMLRWAGHVRHRKFLLHKSLNPRAQRVSDDVLAGLKREVMAYNKRSKALRESLSKIKNVEMDALIEAGRVEGRELEMKDVRTVTDRWGRKVKRGRVSLDPTNPNGGVFDTVSMRGGKLYGAMLSQMPEAKKVDQLLRFLASDYGLRVIRVFVEAGLAKEGDVRGQVDKLESLARG